MKNIYLVSPRIFIISICYLLLTSCAQQRSAEWALDSIQNYRDTAEMSLPNQVKHIEAIKSALNTENGIDALASAYKKTSNGGFKERILYICWALTYDANPRVREKISAFLESVLEKEPTARLRNWAAAGLVQCAAPGMEGVFLDMLKSSQSTMWKHGARGLWKIRSQNAIAALTNQITLKRTNNEFVVTLEKIVTQDSNKWTAVVLRTLR